MTIENIIKAVRLSFDEEAVNASSLATGLVYADDNSLMDNIIKGKIGDALRWVCLYGPAELLGGTDTTGTATNILVDDDSPTVTAITGTTGGVITLPTNFIKLARVRVSGWNRAIKDPIQEDSDEYLQLYTEIGTATADRPQAVIIDRATKKLEIWPWDSNKSVELTYVADTETIISDSDTAVALPPKAITAFIYYLAFLTLSAYGDVRAERMLEIAKMNLGKITTE